MCLTARTERIRKIAKKLFMCSRFLECVSLGAVRVNTAATVGETMARS
jgi:hypothetical protein